MRLDFDAFQYEPLAVRSAPPADPRLCNDAPLSAPRAAAKAVEALPASGPAPEPDDDLVIEGLTQVQCRAIALLMQGQNKSKAARAIGVTRETVSRWFHESAQFKDAYKAQKREVMQEAIALAQAKAVDGVRKLIAKMESPLTDTPDAIRAANSLLRFASEAFETEQVIDKIDEFEAQQRNPEVSGIYEIVTKSEQMIQ